MERFDESAKRYVRKVSANPEMSHNKLLSRIENGSSVLEFGPASGAMTQVLSQDKGCKVSVVEIDKDCYQNVMQYAESGVCADIETFTWEKNFEGQAFDYILFADVLEHLREPEKVLHEVQHFLKPDGSVLISVPNIAHNSIIIQLLKNQFIYQNTGILDYTHVRHYTFSEIEKLCTDAGFGVVYMDAVYIGVGKNEFDISYVDVDPAIAQALKNRPLGEVYQHILEIKKKEYVDRRKIKIENRLGMQNSYTDLVEKKIRDYYSEEDTENQRLIGILCQEPNLFFEPNNEIGRLRLEINEMYSAEENLRKTVDLQGTIDAYRDEIKEKNQHIQSLIQEGKIKDQRIITLQEEEQRRNEHIAVLDSQVNEKDKRIAALNSQIDEMIKNPINKSEREEELKQIILNKEGHIELLLEVERAYEREKKSHAYKIGKKIENLEYALFPINGKRRFLAKVLKDLVCHPRLMVKVVRPSRIKKYFEYIKTEGMGGVKQHYQEVIDKESYLLNPPDKFQVEIIGQENRKKKSIEEYEKLVLPVYENPEVSIIIPVYNQFDYTYSCVKSILNRTGDVTYEIIIANDCSTDITKEIEKVIENIRLVTTEKNVRFLLNCNHASKYVRGKYILFLNNDTQVQQNWLRPLVSLIESDQQIGMVGSKLIYPDGLLQEAGGIIWKDASAWNYGNRKNPENSEYNYVKEADYISGASIMIRKELWESIGGFDERYSPAYCEDSDLAFEIRKRGFKVMYQPASVVVHFEGISNGTDISSGQKSYQTVNQQKFYNKWRTVLEKEQFPNGENVFCARDRSKDKPTLLMVDHYVPQYDKDAGSKTVFQYLCLFAEKGYNVKFIGDNFFRDEPYTTTLQQKGIEVLYGPYYSKNWKNWIIENASNIQYVFLNRPHISVKYIDFIRENTNAKIVYYGHDLHFLRELRNYELTKNPKDWEISENWKKNELSLMHKADVVYYPSEVEVREIKKLDPAIQAKAIPAYIFSNVVDLKYEMSKRKNIMFIGGFRHTPNEDGILWFVKEVFPKLRENIPEIKLYILGSNPTESVQRLQNESIVVKGFVTEEELKRFYETSRIAVVPLRYGAGIKGKVVEAMCYGVPVVTTSVGAEGIIGAEDILCIEDEPDKMSDALIHLYEDRETLSKMSSASIKYIRENFSKTNAWNGIKDDFANWEDK